MSRARATDAAMERADADEVSAASAVLVRSSSNLRAPEFAVAALDSCTRISADSRDKSLLTLDSD